MSGRAEARLIVRGTEMPPEDKESGDRSVPSASSAPASSGERAALPPVGPTGAVSSSVPESRFAPVQEGAEPVREPEGGGVSPTPSPAAEPRRRGDVDDEDGCDIRVLPEEVTSTPAPASHRFRVGDWEHELSAHKVAVELLRIENDVRDALEERDAKRKRKFSGSRRWLELEDDILSWRFTGRFDEATLRRLRELIYRRHYLFNRLRFLASTRPTWNT